MTAHAGSYHPIRIPEPPCNSGRVKYRLPPALALGPALDVAPALDARYVSAAPPDRGVSV